MPKATPLTRGRGVYSPVCAFEEESCGHGRHFTTIAVSQLSHPGAILAVTLNTGQKRRGREPPHGYHRGLSCCLRAVFPLLPTSLCILDLFHLAPAPAPPWSCPRLLSCAASLPTCPSLNLPHAACPFPALCFLVFLEPFGPSSTCCLPILGLCRGPLASPLLPPRPTLCPALRHCCLIAG